MTAADARSRISALLRNTTAVSCVLLALLLVVVQAQFHGGVAAFTGGIVLGAFYGLIALGMVLVYRSNRIINFAQVSMGAISVTLFTQLSVHHVFISAVAGICPSCASNPGLALLALQYALAMVVSLLAAPVVGLMMYIVVRLLGDASRLVVTVAMIGAGLVLDWGAAEVQQLLNGPQAPGTFPSVDVRPPQNMALSVGGAIWDTGTIVTLAVTVTVLIALTVFFTRSRLGVAIRASSENEERARSLGISPFVVQATVWAIAGLLAGLVANLSAMVSGDGGSGGTTISVLLIALAAGVIGRFESLVMTMVAAAVLGVVEYATIIANVGNGISDLVVALVIITVLVLRPAERLGRAEQAAGSWLTTREVRATPAVLRGLAPVRRMRLGVAAVVAVAALGAPYVLSSADTVQASEFLVYGIVGLSLLVVSGWAGQISLGQFAISAVGAYVTGILAGNAGVSVVVVVPIAALAGALVSFVVALPSLRLRGAYLAVTTLALAQVASTVLFNTSLLGRFLPTQLARFSVFGLDGTDNRVFYYTLVVAAAISCVLVRGLRRSRTGRALIASRDNEQAVQSFGISLARARIQAFVFAGFLAGGAGSLFAYLLGTVDGGGFSPQFSETILLMAVLGGLGSLAGPFLGVVYLAVATFVVSSSSGVNAAIGFAVLTLLVLAPGGVSQVVYAGRDAFLRRVAERFAITVPSLLSGSRLDSPGAERIPILPKRTRAGSTEFVPHRYRLDALPENVAALRGRQR
ncbi:MAG: ABC transporter permease [Candidatus Dormibacteria bacterium]